MDRPSKTNQPFAVAETAKNANEAMISRNHLPHFYEQFISILNRDDPNLHCSLIKDYALGKLCYC